MHLVLIYEASIVALTLCREECVEVKLVELALRCDHLQFIGQLVGHHHHSGQRSVGVVAIGIVPLCFCSLLVRICPVVYLLLDKLARVDGTERRTREVEVCTRGDGHITLVEVVQTLARGVCLLTLIFVLE